MFGCQICIIILEQCHNKLITRRRLIINHKFDFKSIKRDNIHTDESQIGLTKYSHVFPLEKWVLTTNIFSRFKQTPKHKAKTTECPNGSEFDKAATYVLTIKPQQLNIYIRSNMIGRGFRHINLELCNAQINTKLSKS